MATPNAYDPFARGRFPVGVRSATIDSPARPNRRLDAEVWYPATAHHRGRDLDPAAQDAFRALPDGPPLRQAAIRGVPPAAGRYPLVIFSHSSAGHRRQSTFLCTHLASHGYVVAAVDHRGNTGHDVAESARRSTDRYNPDPAERAAHLERIIADRVPDARALLDAVLDGRAGGLADRIDAERVGAVGWSFGGWTVLALPEVDDRLGAIVALVPGGNRHPLPGIIPAQLTFRWHRPAPALYLAAEHDPYTPTDGIAELYERTPAPARMVTLRDAGHGHFGDAIEDPGCPPAHAHDFTRGLALAHLDATLGGDEGARRFLAGDPAARLRERGIDAVAAPDRASVPG